jgi:hypothetical protein
MIEKIIFPVHFSGSAMFGSEVTLLHACDLVSHSGFELNMRSLQTNMSIWYSSPYVGPYLSLDSRLAMSPFERMRAGICGRKCDV